MVSVIIPTFNEENYLPRLLDSLAHQTYADYEIIVADADSTDGTRAVASQHGCRVVPGGRPAQGRNAGAGYAQGDYLLFLDADVTLDSRFLQDLMDRVRSYRLAVASGFITPESDLLIDRLMVTVSNLYHFAMQRISPHASGFYIMARKSLHDRIGGFNEELFLTEDHDYVLRAARHGKFRYLWYPRVSFSVRRFNKEGRALLVWKFLVLEIYRLFKEVKHEVVWYEFGKF
jgi:glycosyltransferase involved in cell wall biosynthesis